MRLDEVYALIGEPLEIRPAMPGEVWLYGDVEGDAAAGVITSSVPDVPMVSFDSKGRVAAASRAETVTVGMPQSDVSRLLGSPTVTFTTRDTRRLYYSEPGDWGRYEARIVGVDADGLVTQVYAYASWE
jgi:hypothetical protein